VLISCPDSYLPTLKNVDKSLGTRSRRCRTNQHFGIFNSLYHYITSKLVKPVKPLVVRLVLHFFALNVTFLTVPHVFLRIPSRYQDKYQKKVSELAYIYIPPSTVPTPACHFGGFQVIKNYSATYFQTPYSTHSYTHVCTSPIHWHSAVSRVGAEVGKKKQKTGSIIRKPVGDQLY